MSESTFIIGNGFDLNLGLRTSYKDFLGSDHFKKHISTNDLFGYLNNRNPIKNWIDVERELALYSIKPKEGHLNDQFLDSYKLLKTSLLSYINSIDVTQIDDDSKAYSFIKNNFNNGTTVINFNYTKSIENILKDTHGSFIQSQIIYVHGNSSINDIIFGVEDTANINRKHSFLYKASSLIFNKRGVDITSHLQKYNDIHIFGHSLGESDYSYFAPFFQHAVNSKENKAISIYYYKESGLHSLTENLQAMTNQQLSKLRHQNTVKLIDVS